MKLFFKLSLLALFGFVSIQASLPRISHHIMGRMPKSSLLNNFRQHGAHPYQMNISKATHSSYNRTAVIVSSIFGVTASTIAFFMYLNARGMREDNKVTAQFNKETAIANQKIAEAQYQLALLNKQAMDEQNKKSNNYAEQQIELAKSANTTANIQAGASIGGAVCGGIGGVLAGPPGAAAGIAAGTAAGGIIASSPEAREAAIKVAYHVVTFDPLETLFPTAPIMRFLHLPPKPNINKIIIDKLLERSNQTKLKEKLLNKKTN